MSAESVSILDGSTFVVSDRRGDIAATPTETTGLFHADTRFLSRWVLTVNGVRLNSLSTDDIDYFASQFFLVPGTGTVYVDSPLSVVRRRAVGGGFHEDLTIVNHTPDEMDLDVAIEADADFADIFEVKDALSKKGEHYRKEQGGSLVLGYRRERFIRETHIRAEPPARVENGGLRYSIHLGPHQEWNARFDVEARSGGMLERKLPRRGDEPDAESGEAARKPVTAAPALICPWRPLERTYRRSLIDLSALRFYPLLAPNDALPAAGLPWFMAVFGRDSILTSFQALPFAPDLAATTLKVLGARQGTRYDDFRDEEPGKILHESRSGEMTAFEERPHSPYFGTADATPLFLVLLDEYERWTGNGELVRGLEKEARAALRWIDESGDRDGDGYVEYDRRNKETGLENQCWKDSWDSIRFADGALAPLPRATCEIQGYVYDAKRRCARLAREFWNDPDLAGRLEREAAELKQRFNRDFWVEERGFFALALDGEKRRVDSLTSNIGHLLWSGIAEPDKAEACMRHLMSDALFSGWGVRTMASTEGGYNPIGYHVGTVWPHDNSFIALGLRHYGYRSEAARVALGILEAANFFNHRLPEAFAGYPRNKTRFPVEYPTACSPQAWATGAPLLFLRSLLGLEPVGDHLLVDPAIPKKLERIELMGIPGRWGSADAFGRGLLEVESGADAVERAI
ncbi:MAG TPA: glycogen debranching N-terminal domain-containing protein [Gammaproteobacteria bacterium]|nr:glycogen debranching N-terminal domain-containing protein [Gammaproteobacteria bacterium]